MNIKEEEKIISTEKNEIEHSESTKLNNEQIQKNLSNSIKQFGNKIINSSSEFDINKILRNLKEIPLKNRTSFYKEEQLNEGEDEFTEFKNYYLPLEEDKVEELKRQFCAFLNNKGCHFHTQSLTDNLPKTS